MSSLSAPAPRRQCGRLLLIGSIAIALSHVFINGAFKAQAFAPGSQPDAMSRRIALGSLPLLLGGPQAALAIPRVTDRFEYMNRRKMELVPVFKQGIDYLETHEIDERMLTFLPRLVSKMDTFANLVSREEAPDRFVRRLQKHIKKFETYVQAKDRENALKEWEAYVADVPPGLARFDIKDPSTFEGPKNVPLPEE
eukprot:TRINITY_DN3494_c0_g1_i1.p1 TRINITY_DN3494_c0_g1~~TRINITY_DN3494_c0_g1_i1.p1  ORF type:complete len:196 (-),score=45.78 TRINITY_DN3494_c0_g1_i1:52-639(-)